MGGILIVLVLNLTAILWAQMNPLLELTLLSVLVLTGLGFYDDYAKIIKQQGGGAPPHVKLWVQLEVRSNSVARLQGSPKVWLGLDNAAPAGRRAQFWVRCLGVVGSHVAHSVGQSGSG